MDGEEKKLSAEKAKGIQQVPFRLNMNDHRALKVLLRDDGLTFQKFVTACVEAYLRGDPMIMKAIRSWKELDLIPPHVRGKHMLSQRDRKSLLDEIEATEASEALSDAQGQDPDDRGVRG